MPKTKYGFFNHFVISPRQKETVKRFGLDVQNKGNGVFSVSSKNGQEALEKLVSPFVDSIEDNSVTLSRKELRSFLDFLSQPIKTSAEKQASKKTQERDRLIGHAAARFLTTGHVEIHKFLDEGLASAASLECHEKGERKMKETDVWNYEPELWNPEMNSEKVSSIPGTSYDPKQGFVFDLHDDFVQGRFLDKPNRRILSSVIKDILEDVKGEKITETSVSLNAQNLQDFFEKITQVQDIEGIIKKARVEEKVEVKLQDIRKNAQDLKEDPRFQIAVNTHDKRITDAAKLDNLITASSSLTPVINSQDMFDTWRDSHITEHWMKLSDPVNEVFEEMQVFNMVLQDIRNSDDVNVEHLQAIVHNFRPLVAFASDLIESLQEGADHKKVQKALPEDAREKFQEEAQSLSNAFKAVSVNGIEAGDLDGSYEELLTGVQNVLGQNGNLAKQQLTGYVDMMVGFWKGVGESAFDSPVVAGILVGFVGYAWYTKYGIDPALAQQAAENIFSGVEGASWGDDFSTGGEFTVPQDFIDSFARNSEEVIQDAVDTGEVDTCLIDANCHYNYLVPQFLVDAVDDSVGQYLKFRHYVGSDIIASNAQTMAELLPSSIEAVYQAADIPVNENTVYRDVVENVTYQGGLFVIDANMFQDGSHASMLAYGVTRAGKHGPNAFRGMGGLAAEFTNPAYRIGKWAMKPGYHISSGLMNGTAFVGGVTGLLNEDRAHKMMNTASSLKKKANPKYAERLVETAMTRIDGLGDKLFVPDFEEEVKQDFSQKIDGQITIRSGWYGLKKEKIEISDQLVHDLEEKLNNFALVLEYSAEDIGIESESYPTFVLEKLENVEKAIQNYKASQSPDKIQKLQEALNGDLQHVVGAELKFNGRDEIYRTLFPEVEGKKRGFLSRLFTEKVSIRDDRRLHVLARHASKKEGRLIRKEWRADMAEQRQEAQNRFQKPEKLLSMQSLKYAWGGVEKYASKFKYTGAQAINHVWGGIVFGAREGIQEPFNQIPNKGKLALAFGAAALAGLGLDVAGVSNALVDTFSGAAAAVTGITSTGLIAGLLNIPQDLLLHTAAIGVSAGAVGIPWYYSVQKGAKPLSQAVAEKLSPSL